MKISNGHDDDAAHSIRYSTMQMPRFCLLRLRRPWTRNDSYQHHDGNEEREVEASFELNDPDDLDVDVVVAVMVMMHKIDNYFLFSED